MADAVFLACMFVVIGVVSAFGVWSQVNGAIFINFIEYECCSKYSMLVAELQSWHNECSILNCMPQNYFFAASGANLTMKLRKMVFAAILKQVIQS